MDKLGNFELNKIYNMDCLEGMKQLPDESIDLVVTSPPYNKGGQNKSFKNWNGAKINYNDYDDNLDENEYQKWQINILNECYRILKKMVVCFIIINLEEKTIKSLILLIG